MFASIEQELTNKQVSSFYVASSGHRDAFVVDCSIDKGGQVWFDFEVIPPPDGRDVLTPLLLSGCVFGISLIFEGKVFTPGDHKPKLYRTLEIWGCGLVAKSDAHPTCVKPIVLGAPDLDPREGANTDLVSGTLSRIIPGIVLNYDQSYVEDLEITRQALRQSTQRRGSLIKQWWDAVTFKTATEDELECSRDILDSLNEHFETEEEQESESKDRQNDNDEDENTHTCSACGMTLSIKAHYRGDLTECRISYCPMCGKSQGQR